MSGQSKKHTLKGGTSPYSLSMGVPPQGGGELYWLGLLIMNLITNAQFT